MKKQSLLGICLTALVLASPSSSMAAGTLSMTNLGTTFLPTAPPVNQSRGVFFLSISAVHSINSAHRVTNGGAQFTLLSKGFEATGTMLGDLAYPATNNQTIEGVAFQEDYNGDPNYNAFMTDCMSMAQAMLQKPANSTMRMVITIDTSMSSTDLQKSQGGKTIYILPAAGHQNNVCNLLAK